MLQKTLIALAALSVLIASPSYSDEIDNFIEAQLAQRRIPGLAYAVIRDGRITDTRT